MNTLEQLANQHGSDKGTHGYCRFYQQYLEPLRDQPIRLLEIGVNYGASIRMWLDYLPKASVYGVDIYPHGTQGPPQPEVSHERYRFVQGDQSKPEFWEMFLATHGSDWNVIIDDGGHTSGQIITSFECLWKHVAAGGLYVIEDLAQAYVDDCQTPKFPNHMAFIGQLLHFINWKQKDIEHLQYSNELAIIRKHDHKY